MTAGRGEGFGGAASWDLGGEIIHRIALPLPARVQPVNAYLVDCDEPVLIDAGFKLESGWTALGAGLAERGRTIGDIRHLVITHAHADHFGLAARIVAASGARVYAHPTTLERVADVGRWVRRVQTFQDTLLRRSDAPELAWQFLKVWLGAYVVGSESLPENATHVPLAEGDRLTLGDRKWRVLVTPGHTDGMICLFDEASSTLLSSDLIVPERPYHVVAEPRDAASGAHQGTVAAFLSSLARIESLSAGSALSGHGNDSDDPTEAIRAQRRQCLERREQVLTALIGPATVREIWMSLDGDGRRVDVRQGILEIRTYLELLANEKLVVAHEENGLDYYAAVR